MIDFTHEDIERLWDSVVHYVPERQKLDMAIDFIKSLDLKPTHTIIGNRQIYTSSMGEGKTAVEKQKKGNAVDEIKKLSDQILNELN